jgi:hypothetical protein
MLVCDRRDQTQWLAYFVALDFAEGAIVGIRDFPLPATHSMARTSACSDIGHDRL